MLSFYPQRLLVLLVTSVLLLFSACKRDKTPKEKFEIKNAGYNVTCINCTSHGTPDNVYNYSKVRINFDVQDGEMSKFGSEAYVRINYVFPSGVTGTFVRDYSELTISGRNVSFNTEWAWGWTNSVDVTFVMYTGRGMKTDQGRVVIYKPDGAYKLSAKDAAFED